MTTSKRMQSLSRLFETLRGGLIVAAAESSQGTVRLIVENRPALSAIRDSWGRVAVTLTGCRGFGFTSADGVVPVDLARIVAGLKPVVREAHCHDGVCRVECSFGLTVGSLEIDADSFAIMLGGGRTLSLGELLGELTPAAPAYARAS